MTFHKYYNDELPSKEKVHKNIVILFNPGYGDELQTKRKKKEGGVETNFLTSLLISTMEKIWMSKCCIMLFLMLMEQPAPKNITSSENGPLIDQNIRYG